MVFATLLLHVTNNNMFENHYNAINLFRNCIDSKQKISCIMKYLLTERFESRKHHIKVRGYMIFDVLVCWSLF